MVNAVEEFRWGTGLASAMILTGFNIKPIPCVSKFPAQSPLQQLQFIQLRINFLVDHKNLLSVWVKLSHDWWILKWKPSIRFPLSKFPLTVSIYPCLVAERGCALNINLSRKRLKPEINYSPPLQQEEETENKSLQDNRNHSSHEDEEDKGSVYEIDVSHSRQVCSSCVWRSLSDTEDLKWGNSRILITFECGDQFLRLSKFLLIVLKYGGSKSGFGSCFFTFPWL